MDYSFDPDKLTELVLYVAAKLTDDPSFDRARLNEILCLCDFHAYARLGKPITGATYRALDSGPGAEELDEVEPLLATIREAITVPAQLHRGHTDQELQPRREANLNRFSAAEIALVDMVLETLRRPSPGVTPKLSYHSLVGWQLAPRGSVIPYASVFLSPEPLTQADIADGQTFAARHGWLDSVD